MEATLKQIFDNVLKGEADTVKEQVKKALDEGQSADVILKSALIGAMDEVGKLFEAGEYFVPEMLVAARAMQAGLGVLKPHLAEGGIEATGKVVLGTVKGDLHDIGKNLVGMMLEGAGFEIVDLGTDVSAEAFVNAVTEHNAKILGLSALLTTTMQNMVAVIDALKEAGIRDKVYVMIGGAPVTDSYAREIGADAYAPDASRAVAMAKA